MVVALALATLVSVKVYLRMVSAHVATRCMDEVYSYTTSAKFFIELLIIEDQNSSIVKSFNPVDLTQ